MRRLLHARATEYLQCNDPDLTESQRLVRTSIAKICANFPDEYWAKQEELKKFPTELYDTLAKDGWLGICMPEQYGGSGLGIAEAAVMMQTISECGGGMTVSYLYSLLISVPRALQFNEKPLSVTDWYTRQHHPST
jgi:alkylation response protein AidB-like acyl-CoA dehydrogenase